MDFPNTRLDYLFGRYYDKTATAEELEELAILLNLADDEALSDIMQKQWDGQQNSEEVFSTAKRDQMLSHILNSSHKPHDHGQVLKMPWYNIKYVAAAAILIIIGLGTIFFLQSKQNDKQYFAETSGKINDILPGGNKATLTLTNGKTIVLDQAQKGVLLNDGNVEVKKATEGQVSYQVADQTEALAGQFNVLATPKGGQYQLVLPDGSKVWLNAASSIKFPSAFAGNRREVELSGEAYFEVAKNPSKPFIVKSRLGDIQVLGTHFNVMAYDDEATMKTTLLEGAVRISSKYKSSLLKPGEQADLSKDGDIHVTDHVDVDKEIAWKDGLFYFNDSAIELVMRQAARWYNIEVSYEGGIPTKRLTGKISRNVKASELLNMLKYSGINFRLKNNQVIVTN